MTAAGRVLVLNAGYEPLHEPTLKHAINMLVRGVAMIEEVLEGATFGPCARPLVLRLASYVKVKWRQCNSACTKEGVKNQDGHCAYCRGRAEISLIIGG